MMIKAMEVSGIEGNFRTTCEAVLRVLRTHKDSLMVSGSVRVACAACVWWCWVEREEDSGLLEGRLPRARTHINHHQSCTPAA
jgi:hypothetical protein